MKIPALLEKYGRLNRLVGDYRACVVRADLGTEKHRDALNCLERTMTKLARIENTLEDMGLMAEDDRHTDRGIS